MFTVGRNKKYAKQTNKFKNYCLSKQQEINLVYVLYKYMYEYIFENEIITVRKIILHGCQ